MAARARILRRMSDPIARLEAHLAHLTRSVEDLSDIVRQQAYQIDRLIHRVQRLTEREAEREVADGASAPLADQRPPHW